MPFSIVCLVLVCLSSFGGSATGNQDATVALAGATAGCDVGRYLVNNPATCEDCGIGFYCPGGKASSSQQYSCNWANNSTTEGLTTRIFRASSRANCVAMPGYRYIPSTAGQPTAARCPANTFSAYTGRQARCSPCPAGMKTDPDENGLRTSAGVCKVPPGWFWAGTAVARCPKGEYRVGYVDTAAAYSCQRCPAGTTTQHANSTSLSHCNVLLRGYHWLSTTDKMQQTPATEICPQNSYCSGGPTPDSDSGMVSCSTIATGLWTKGLGASAPSECMIPPGHYFTAAGSSGVVAKCPNGDADNPNGLYQPEWVQYNGAATTCTACGAGILSDDKEPLSIYDVSDDGSGAPTAKLVPKTDQSCYILRGQGMVVAAVSNSGKPLYKAVTCGSNQFGASGDAPDDVSYGLGVQICHDCPTGTVTVDATTAASNPDKYRYDTSSGAFYSPDACITLPGYQYNGNSATPCPKGWYNPAVGDSASKCIECPDGTTTAGTASKSIDDCALLLPGWQYSYTADPYASLSLCDIGSYYAKSDRDIKANSVEGKCTPCPDGKMTSETGASDITQCDVCPAGKGTTSTSNGACVECPSGTYGSSSRAPSQLSCQACPTAIPYSFAYGGDLNVFTSPVVSKEGSTSASLCMPEFAQVENGNWKLSSSGSMEAAVGASSLPACVEACRSQSSCQFLTFDYAAADETKCMLRVGGGTGSTSAIAYKIMPTSGIVQAQGMGFGGFSAWGDANAAEVGSVTQTVE
ncbi:hypothetical protein OEZ86_011976 [Tetradesmus obliquus]|nr:hypothetical protein OEZ86_011976 [Tetradesmus obliquus]